MSLKQLAMTTAALTVALYIYNKFLVPAGL